MPGWIRSPGSFLLVVLLGLTASAGPRKPKGNIGIKPPQGFVKMNVAGVMETNGGKAVVLKEDKKDGFLLPIWIGDAEAFSIQLRLDRRRFQRPLTHDLLDTIMQKLGGQLVKIHVDDLKQNTFVGTIFIQQKGKTLAIDARPSDSIALALGSHAPIFVSSDVLKRAGVREEKETPGRLRNPSDPEKLLKDILESDREEHTL